MQETPKGRLILPNLAEKASLMLMGGDESAGLIFS